MNLQSLGVQELNANEIRETDGGGFFDNLFHGVSYEGHGSGLRYFASAISNTIKIGVNAAKMGVAFSVAVITTTK